ncbi:MAG: hypothetical protein IJD80_03625, partial [Oscillospiraceae bacterium]|nr:hypothetical protein [Oscillospiraceae bacterium]
MTDKHKVFTVRRLFRCDSEIVGRCYEEFDFLHFNPVGKSRIESIFAQGQIWGAFDGDRIIACSYMLRADAPFFTQLDAYWEISDLLDDSLEDFLVAGYVWIDSEYRDYPVYAAMSKLWNITAMKKGLGKVLHCVPAHIYFSMGELFESGFLLCGLRGLDKLVPHY